MLIAVQLEQFLRGEKLDNDEKHTKQEMEKKAPLVKESLRLMAPRHRRALTFKMGKLLKDTSVATAVKEELANQSGRQRAVHNKVLLKGMDWTSENEEEWEQGLGAPDTLSDSDEEAPRFDGRVANKGPAGLGQKSFWGRKETRRQRRSCRTWAVRKSTGAAV
jgi:hypothetical protein